MKQWTVLNGLSTVLSGADPWGPRTTALPQNLHSELHLPRIVGGCNRTERGGAAHTVRRSVVDAVEQIECLEPQLETRLPHQHHLLGQREIDRPVVRSAHTVAFSVAKRLAGISRDRHARGIEPS